MLKKAKTIHQIFDEVKNFDLVITNDAPLATALNRLVETPRLDYLAVTPRQLASKFALLNFGKIYTRPEIILEITKQTGKPLKIIHQSVDRIFDIWNHTGLLESCKLYIPHESEIIDLTGKLASIELAMEKFDEAFYGKKKIAVVGLELFSELDKQVLPKNMLFDKISIFSNKTIGIDKSYLFSSANQLINQTVTLINKDNENDVAVVLNPDSEFLEVIKARLKNKGVNLQIKSYLSSDLKTLDLLTFIENSLSLEDLSVKDTIVIESLFSERLDRAYDLYSLSYYMSRINKNATLKLIYGIMGNITKQTYDQLFETLTKKLLIKITAELYEAIELTGLSDTKITSENLNLLKYFIKNIDIELNQIREGVLFVNSMNSAFIDRQIVFYIGLDQSWTRLNPDKLYVDKKDEEQKNLDKFQILMSQGEQKYYFVLGSKHNQTVLPCYYFNVLVDRTISSFENDFFNTVKINYPDQREDYKKISKDRKADSLEQMTDISPSSMNKFIYCPKHYSFSRIIPDERNPYTLKGTLMHAFADFYFNQPDYTKEHFDELLQYLIDEFEGIVSKTNIHVERTTFAIGMKLIMKFLDERKFQKVKLEAPESQPESILFRKTGLKKLYSNTEQWIEQNDSHMIGKIDLYSENSIVDYKSGREKEEEVNLLSEFKMHRLEKQKSPRAGFQTVAYIAGIRDNHPDMEINFTYYFFLAEFKNFIKENVYDGNMLSRIKYIPLTFEQYILSEKAFEEGFLIRKKKEDKSEIIFLKRLGFDLYKKIISSGLTEVDFYDYESVKEIFENKFYNTALNEAGMTWKEFRKQKENTFKDHIIEPVLDYIHGLRIGFRGKGGYIYKDDVDEFLKLVHKVIAEIDSSRNSYFASRPLFNMREVCEECSYLNLCVENKLWSADETN